MSERDTQFAHSAKSVVEQIIEVDGVWIDTTNDYFREEWEQIIAQYAYDLAYHLLEFTRRSQAPSHLQFASTETWIRTIPDLTAWPEVERE